MIREVKTDLDPEDVHDALLSTFQKWIEFAMGMRKLGGRKLKTPSGKMATALRADTDKDGNVVALYIDPESAGGDTNNFLMYGHKRVHLKTTMLRPGAAGVRYSKDRDGKRTGYLYRYIPIANKPRSPAKIWQEAEHLKNLITTRKTPQGQVMGVNKSAGRMWLANYANAHSGERTIRTMSNKPGSAKWEIPAMKPFNVAKLLKDMLPSKLKGRVVI